MAISLLTLNVRSVKDQVRRVGTLSFLAAQNHDVCFLQECGIPYAQSYSQLERQWTHGPSFWSGGNDCKSSGVAILIKGRHFTTDRVTEQVNGRVLVVDGSWSGEPVRLINVYAPPEKNERLEMFRVLRMQLVTSRTILMGGDFNCTVELDGRTGSDSAGMDVTSRLLVEMTGEASLQDVVGSMGPNARNYSWSRPDGSVHSRIDFLFTSPTVKPGRNSMVAVHFSDHRAVSFEGELTGKFPAGPGSWKLNCSLLENEELVANLRVAYVEWRDMRDLFHSAGEWWEWVKDRFRSFFQDASRAAAREKKRDFRQLQSKLQRLFELELRGWDVDDELEETRKGLAEHFREESRKIIFRTRTENLEKDEKCNSFFFKKLHSARTPLVELRDSEGNLQSGKEHVMRVVTDFYGELYSPKSSERSQADSFLKGISKTLSPEEREGLNAPFTLEELHLAATTSKRGKTPGSDGLPVELYVELWDLIGPDLLELYGEVVGKGSLPQSLREGMITLLYKQKGEKEDLKNWRPISLLNVDYKLLAKAMANHLKKVIEKIVHPDQTCGIPGRQIADSLALVRDTIEYVKSRKVPTALVSLDQEKAFDRVSHEFMDRTLRALGLGDFFCDVFGKASGAKINSAKSETLLFGHWTPTRDPLPFPIKQDFLKILGVWFGGKGAAEKSWEERLAKTKQKLGLWSLRKLTIEGKSLVLWNETLPVLLYIAQVWPVQSRTAKAITRMIFYFIWNSKMDRVKREVMFKTHDKGGKGVPDIATILRGTFVCHCVRNTLRAKDESHAGFLMARFFLLPTWRRLGWAEWDSSVPYNWETPWFYKEVEKFIKEHGPAAPAPTQWTPKIIHRQIRARDVSEPIGALPSATADHVWRNVASKRLTNQHKDIAWMAIQGGLPVRAFMHARGLNRYKSCPRGCTADETTYHLFWECAYAQDLLKALSTELGAWTPTTCITADSVMYGLFPGSHALGDLQGCWRLLCCLKDVLLFSRNRLVVGKKETSTLVCRKMIHSLLRDYAALDGSDDDSDDET
ncbi:hypothetical protein NDU88_000291 [Pleurodeles waltl]|uniref:Reverse transcriptase domain-containing protein n=1 Tax=Pleurodeles waltl TaxID=8319 RepID=A0AAV7WIZ6_PLEWA|nr:hypothetical protein NDU88_000291 [Pleurodeles waltl]